MNILGIETSCDETAAAVVKDGREILSNVVVSQIDIFAKYGGVIPEVAARSHLEAMMPVVDKALNDANCTWDDIDAIAVTHAPGLLGSLLIGTLTARTLAILHKKPLYAVHHLKSHIYANWLNDDCGPRTFQNVSPVPFPLLALVVSGGHMQILYMPAH
ncbi:tRNA (adenosine(37)-N6)-threonylcarbamoyltransferase complex transferase subunit TsaD, partial [Candidatus Saccharibacteria bacterium]|nr:tRNA (adenosine(37)-N6)-threonylcarbamoyltransferase complex transferase subunit TsaD [Candidatus Saccharibacteria bacterium]